MKFRLMSRVLLKVISLPCEFILKLLFFKDYMKKLVCLIQVQFFNSAKLILF